MLKIVIRLTLVSALLVLAGCYATDYQNTGYHSTWWGSHYWDHGNDWGHGHGWGHPDNHGVGHVGEEHKSPGHSNGHGESHKR